MIFAQPSHLSLEGNLTMRTAGAIHAQLLGALAAHEETVISLPSDVQIDISFLQLIEAARVYAKVSGKRISLARPAGAELLDLLRRAGFLDALSDDDAQFWLHQGKIQ